MCVRVPLDFTQQELEKISKDLQITLNSDKKFKKFAKDEFFDVYDVDGEYGIFPLAYAKQNLGISLPKRNMFRQFNYPFTGVLREEQILVKDESISFLNKNGAVIISCYPGFGKTITAINIANKIGLKTLIVVNKIPLIDQWEKSISFFVPDAKIKILTTKTKIDDDDDFVIVNCINIPKFGNLNFGTVIVDECHLIMSKILSTSMFKLFPKYVIGLSATPYRPDGLNRLLDIFFTTDRIVRKLNCPHTVYKVQTKFKPTIEQTNNGTLNWNKVIDSLCLNEERNNLIVDIVRNHSDRVFMILSKRVEQCTYLYDKLTSLGEKVSLLVGGEREYDRDSRVLIGTIGKIGVGFDHDKINALILASDVEEYFIQYLGRTMRRDKTDKDYVIPIIFDIVDKHSLLTKHYATREKTYKDVGGKIINFDFKF